MQKQQQHDVGYLGDRMVRLGVAGSVPATRRGGNGARLPRLSRFRKLGKEGRCLGGGLTHPRRVRRSAKAGGGVQRRDFAGGARQSRGRERGSTPDCGHRSSIARTRMKLAMVRFQNGSLRLLGWRESPAARSSPELGFRMVENSSQRRNFLRSEERRVGKECRL